MNLSHYIRLTVFCITMAAFACSQPSAANRPITDSLDIIDICRLHSEAEMLNGQMITVSGQITGYHEIVMYSDNCPGNDNLLQLDLDKATWKQLFDKYRAVTAGRVDIRGRIVVQGQFSWKRGTLMTYPPRKVDLNKPVNPEPLTVNLLDNVVLKTFEPL